MQKRKAVIVWGFAKTGKTSTIKYLLGGRKRLVNTYYNIPTMDNKIVKVYVKGSSPSESKTKLSQIFKNIPLPERLIVAEQINGKNAFDTVEFLRKNKYEVTFFVIQKPAQYNHTHWDYIKNFKSLNVYLPKRAQDIKAAL